MNNITEKYNELKCLLFDKDEYNKLIYEKYKDCLTSFADLIGDGYEEPSKLFYLINHRFLYLLDNDPEIAIRKKDIKFRKKFYRILEKFGHLALACTQQFEDRNYLNNPEDSEKDQGVVLPDSPVIFVSNHGFRDDILATVLAAKRSAYIFLGSLPEFYNTTNGIAMYLVGDIMMNRKSKESKKASLDKVSKLLDEGTSLIMFPEGGWNKDMSNITLPLWRGVYEISKRNKCDVVPIIHYNENMEMLSKDNIIHTVVDEPIHLYEMEEKEALEYLREVMSTWQYRMMELYGKSTREEEMKGFNTCEEKWEAHMKERMKGVGRYDSSIEKCADFRDKQIARPEDVYESIANVKNITPENAKMVSEARKILEIRKNSDFQRRF